jgi:hypothetical protein
MQLTSHRLYYHVLPVLSCPVLSCPVLSCPVLSCPVLSCPVLSCPVCRQHTEGTRTHRSLLFPLSLNNPFVDRGNGRWNCHTGLDDCVLRLLCISFSFGLQYLSSITTCLLLFRKTFQTVPLLPDRQSCCSACLTNALSVTLTANATDTVHRLLQISLQSFATNCTFSPEDCLHGTTVGKFYLRRRSLRRGKNVTCSVEWLTNYVWRCSQLRKSQ